MPAKPNDGIDIYDYYLTNDLIERNIIANRHDLTDLIANKGFPRGLKFSDHFQARRLFPKVEVHKWLDEQLKPAPNYAPIRNRVAEREEEDSAQAG